MWTEKGCWNAVESRVHRRQETNTGKVSEQCSYFCQLYSCAHHPPETSRCRPLGPSRGSSPRPMIQPVHAERRGGQGMSQIRVTCHQLHSPAPTHSPLTHTQPSRPQPPSTLLSPAPGGSPGPTRGAWGRGGRRAPQRGRRKQRPGRSRCHPLGETMPGDWMIQGACSAGQPPPYPADTGETGAVGVM